MICFISTVLGKGKRNKPGVETAGTPDSTRGRGEKKAINDLDRDFWNNNDSSTVQQKMELLSTKEFVLNISPYAPYGDPRLTLNLVVVADVVSVNVQAEAGQLVLVTWEKYFHLLLHAFTGVKNCGPISPQHMDYKLNALTPYASLMVR
ncbi:hypothetical protein SKAU_G00410220 [Synaphobranchus kaupii]|uniref:Uncharacterized protein n=1 Tax=Synaphobranchus kaupii TaxID=118154 RepID=A0A9Q1I9Q5_SYNKA|nr:hypothetical protein SKAU_G00410220 [Synaphobranchus kaupii]